MPSESMLWARRWRLKKLFLVVARVALLTACAISGVALPIIHALVVNTEVWLPKRVGSGLSRCDGISEFAL